MPIQPPTTGCRQAHGLDRVRYSSSSAPLMLTHASLTINLMGSTGMQDHFAMSSGGFDPFPTAW